MVDPVQAASNSTSYIQYFTDGARNFGGRLVSKLPNTKTALASVLGVGKLVTDAMGCKLGAGLGVIAIGGGLYILVSQGVKSVTIYNHIEISQGASWKGVLKHAFLATCGLGLAAIGTAALFAGLDNLGTNVVIPNTNSSALNDTKIVEVLKEVPKVLQERLPCLGPILREIPQYFEANGSCFYIFP